MKKNILILYGPLLHYRIPLFNELCKCYNVTVIASSYNGDESTLMFRLIIRKPFKIWRFCTQLGIRAELSKGSYDVCIVFLDIAWLSYLSQIFLPKKCRIIAWGAWLTNSKIANYTRFLAIKVADGSLFYSDAYMQDFITLGANEDKMFVAHNTIKVNCSYPAYYYEQKDIILFVGSLHYRKGNDLLIRAFNIIVPLIPEHINLIFVGEGSDGVHLEALVDEYKLSNRIEFVGAINDHVELQKFYNRAIISVSLKQAGLSVLQSMGHGVPFLTTKGSISGGEIYNIVPKINGIVCELEEEIIGKELVILCNNLDYARKLGQNAFEHYIRYCTIENYARGFADAIEEEKKAIVWNVTSFARE